MASSDTPFTVTYHKHGVEPPVYLAGSFSNPPWEPQKMQHSKTSNGEHLFSREVRGVAGRGYEIKFRIGDGNWWVYDEQKPIVTDCDGNENNIITIPMPGSCEADRRPSVGKVLNELGLRDHGCMRPSISNSGLVITQSAPKQNTPVIDTRHVPEEAPEPEYTWEKKEADPMKTPLFAHECFGAYEFMADDRMDNVDALELEHRRQSRKLSKDYNIEQMDVNDPSIEKFPSDKTSVLDSLRKIQSSLPADQIPVDDAPAFSSIEFRRSSVDSGDDSAVSTGSLSPTTPTAHRMRDNRPSYSSFGKTKSTVSLTSIAEEPKAGGPMSPRTPASSLLKPGRGHSPSGIHTPPSDGDGPMTMKGYQAKHKHIQSGRDSSSYDSVDEPRLDCPQVLGPSHEIA